MTEIGSQFEVDAQFVTAPTGVIPSRERMPKGFIVAAVFLQLSVGVASVGMVLVAWPVTIARLVPDEKVFYLSVVSSIVAGFMVVLTPLYGALSDRCTWRFGMRRPFILFGSLVSAAGLGAMGAASSITTLLAGAAMYAVGNAALTSACYVIIPDQVPRQYRGRAQGAMMAAVAVSGVLASVFLPPLLNNQLLLFGIPAIVQLVGAALVLFLLQDRVLPREQSPGRLTLGSLLADFKINPRTVPDWSWVWLAKVVFILATVLASTYSVYVLTDQIGVSQSTLSGVLTLNGLIGLAATLGGAIFGGWISDKLGKRKAIVISTALVMSAGALVIAFSGDVLFFIIGSALTAIALGVYSPTDGALAIDVLPGEGKQSGKFMSLMAVADQLPRAFGPLLGSVVVALGAATAMGGYAVTYIAAAVISLIGGLLILKVRGGS
ncbi:MULTISPECIES: MFS transporter [unclassified Microbacterium]|uniref:MFS transporter n=1 Tax=unclassified Microbacterium TaxID=2609290 RepID=UPI003853506E